MPRYWRKNNAAFEAYGSAPYADFREEAFQPDGSRWPDDHWLKRVDGRLAGHHALSSRQHRARSSSGRANCS